jgi:hypothetical protein
VEELARLDLNTVKAAGLLDAGSEMLVTLTSGDSQTPLPVTVRRKDTTTLLLSWVWAGRTFELSIQLTRIKRRFGFAPAFVCPETGDRCLSLYYLDGRFASRRALGLAYTSQLQSPEERLHARAEQLIERIEGSADRGAARGANRLRLLGQLRGLLPQLVASGSSAAGALRVLDIEDWRDRARRARQRPTPSASPMLCRVALQAGRRLSPKWGSQEMVARINQAFGAASPPNVRPIRRAPAILEQHAELDVRAFRRKAGYGTGQKLAWPIAGEPSGLVVMGCLDGGGGGGERLLLARLDPDRKVTPLQAIAMQHGKYAGDVFFVCPVSGASRRKLYYRGGYFASASAQRLIRASQRSPQGAG